MAYELVRYQKLRTDLINKTELPSQLVYSREARVTPYAYGGVRRFGDDVDNAVDVLFPGLRGNALSTAAYNAGKTEALGVLSKLAASDVGQKITAGLTSLQQAGGHVADYVTAVKEGTITADATGVFLTASMGESILDVSLGFANAMGANKKVTSQIKNVAGSVSACTGALVAGLGAQAVPVVGNIAGAAIAGIGCAMSAIMTALGFLEGTNPVELPSQSPRAYYRPSQAQTGIVQGDAARLASVLHFWYSQQDMAAIAARLKRWPYFDSRYPSAPPRGLTGELSWGERSQEPIPGFDTWAILQALAFEHGDNHEEAGEEIRMALFEIANNRVANENAKPSTVDQPGLEAGAGMNVSSPIWGLRQRYINWNDINVAAIRTGAATGRGLLRAGASMRVTTDYRVPRSGSFDGWGDFVGDLYGRVRTADYTPFVRLSELLHFFAAVTIREIETGKFLSSRYGETPYITRIDVLTSNLPVRFLLCPTGANFVCAQFGDARWTTLQCGAPPATTKPGDTLLKAVLAKDYNALLEFAFIRIAAAFSHLFLAYQWLDSTDAIRTIAAGDRSPFSAPVDPRTVANGELDSMEAVTIGSNSWTGRYSGPILDTFDQIRDMDFLADLIDRVETAIGPAYNQGRRDGVGILGINWPAGELPGEDTSFVMTRPGAMVALTTANQGRSLIDPAMKAAMMRGEFANVGDMSGQYAQQCIKEGGVVTWNAAGEIQCNPSAAAKPAMEAKCRASGGVPTWMQGRKGQQMRCLPPMHPDAPKQLAVAGSSNSIVPIVGIAAVALLAFRFLK